LEGHYEQVAESLQLFIDQNPMMLEAYDWLAKSYEALGNNEEAVAVLNKAIAISPQTILRQRRLGLLADKTENIDTSKKGL
jgi:Tetratricopeptide repeat.